MTIARAHLVDPSVSRGYHCITRCVRQACLLGASPNDRKVWIESRPRELVGVLSVAIAAFSVQDNHLHVLLRLDPALAGGWTEEDTASKLALLEPTATFEWYPACRASHWIVTLWSAVSGTSLSKRRRPSRDSCGWMTGGWGERMTTETVQNMPGKLAPEIVAKAIELHAQRSSQRRIAEHLGVHERTLSPVAEDQFERGLRARDLMIWSDQERTGTDMDRQEGRGIGPVRDGGAWGGATI
jgi:hypothetical protein